MGGVSTSACQHSDGTRVQSVVNAVGTVVQRFQFNTMMAMLSLARGGSCALSSPTLALPRPRYAAV